LSWFDLAFLGLLPSLFLAELPSFFLPGRHSFLDGRSFGTPVDLSLFSPFLLSLSECSLFLKHVSGCCIMHTGWTGFGMGTGPPHGTEGTYSTSLLSLVAFLRYQARQVSSLKGYLAQALFRELAQKVYRYPSEIGFEQSIIFKPTWTMTFDELKCMNCEI
jgi:hypothetical protein